MIQKRISSGFPFEKTIGFSRAVRTGSRILVSGTAPIAEEGSPAFPDDVYRQTRHCLQIIEKAIIKAGGQLEDVIRTRIYLTDADTWQEAGRAHGEFFGEIRPASTFIEVSRLIGEGLLLAKGAETFEVYYPGESHTMDNTVVFLHARKVLFGGCMILSMRHRRPGFTDHANLAEWPESVRKVQEKFPASQLVIPGHGPVGGNELLDHTRRILEDFNNRSLAK